MKTRPSGRALRADLPFRRLALVLSGGGALGAYEVGALRTLENVGLTPAILAGVSVGAVNAVLWTANRFRTEPLERIWASLRASTVGLRWGRLALRTAGLFLVMFALVQSVLTLAGTHDLDTAQWFGRR